MAGQLNFNSLLSLVTIGTLSWAGVELNSNGKVLATVSLQISINTRAIAELNSEVKSVVPRAEFQARLREIDVEISSLRARIGGPR